MSSLLFDVRNIHFGYEGETVFNDFSMTVKHGEKLAIQGESGAGKTTLFRLMLGFEIPDEGIINYKENPLTTANIKQLRKEVSWLPQDLNLGAGKTSELIHSLFDFQANQELKPGRTKIITIFEQLGLEKNLLDNNFSDLSTGQRQRVGLACCFLLYRKILLLDEPTSALDEQSKENVADLLLKDNLTIISTSHDPWWLEKCDRIIKLEKQS